MTAYAAGLLLIEALERAGHDLSRRKLIDTLEAVQGFDTGLLPPLSYNADRRIGSMGGFVLGIAPDGSGLRPLGGYLTP
jgi:ABC-type branched-subunit amino acid transport system substrate-binding protein